jgi:exonuclease VII large subunit
MGAGLKRNLQNNVQMISSNFSALTNSLKLPYDLINFNKSKIRVFSKSLYSLVRRDFLSVNEKYNYYIKLIEANSIQSNLKKGYSIISKNKKIINKSRDIKENDTLSATLMDSTIEIKIKKIN